MANVDLVKEHAQLAAQVEVLKNLLMSTINENRELKLEINRVWDTVYSALE